MSLCEKCAEHPPLLHVDNPGAEFQGFCQGCCCDLETEGGTGKARSVDELMGLIMHIVKDTEKPVCSFDRDGDYAGRRYVPDYDRIEEKIRR